MYHVTNYHTLEQVTKHVNCSGLLLMSEMAPSCSEEVWCFLSRGARSARPGDDEMKLPLSSP